MLVEHWRIKWYRRKAALFRGWFLTGNRPDVANLNAVLPQNSGAPESKYWTDNSGIRSECLSAAERAARGQIDLFSAGSVQWRDSEFWKRHPITGALVPFGFHPYTVDDFPSGDPNLAQWLSTLPFLPMLAQAYRLSGSERFLGQLCESVDQSAAAYSPVRSPWWEDGLVIALRAVAILYAISLAEMSIPQHIYRRVKRQTLASGRALELLVKTPSFNHRVMSAFGLFCCGVALRDHRLGKQWTRLGAEVLKGDLTRQFFKDGFHGERSPGYMRFVLEIYLHFRVLGGLHGVTYSADFDQRLLRACEALMQISDPRGNFPNFGDDSDMDLFAANRSATSSMALAAVLFQRPDFKSRCQFFPPVAYWITGEDGYSQFRAMPAEPATTFSCALPHAGFYVMQASGRALRLTCGVELTKTKGHSHADLLSFELQVGDDRVLVDPGTYAYYPSRKWRDYFLSTSAHNTGAVDGQSQGIGLPRDHFGWASFPEARVHTWLSNERLDYFDAEHDGYRRLTEPVSHRRRVLFVKPDCWLIIDDFKGSGVHRCELFFQFAAGDVQLKDPRHAVSRRTWGNLDIWQLAELEEADIVSGRESEPRGWISLGYGDCRPAPSLRFCKKAELPIRFETMLIARAVDEVVSVFHEEDAVHICRDRMNYRIRVPEVVTSLEDIVVESISSEAPAVL